MYEVNWYFEPNEANVWVQNDILIKMSYKRLDGREDEPQAAVGWHPDQAAHAAWC